MRGYRLSSSGDPALLDHAAQHLINAVTRDPAFALAHATLSFVCRRVTSSSIHPACGRRWSFAAVARWETGFGFTRRTRRQCFSVMGPSKNFQHLEAIAELRRALLCRITCLMLTTALGTILAHIGVLDHARGMYQRGRTFNPRREISQRIVQVYIWSREFDLAREEIQAWRAENPGNKYPHYFAPQPAMMTRNWKEAKVLFGEALRLLPEEPFIVSLQGVFDALTGKTEPALECLTRACASAKSFGHAHHTYYYQVACILALLGRPEAAFEWLERSVSTGFACWPFL